MKSEKSVRPINGYLILIFPIAIIAALAFLMTNMIINPIAIFPLVIMLIFILKGFFIIYPNQSVVMTLFGEYKGTAKEDGFRWANPFYNLRKVSLRARNFDSERIKVNDKIGNPILISVILVWRVLDTYKASFEVDDYENFVRVQTDAAVRELAASYPYDNFDDDAMEISLRSDFGEVNNKLEQTLDSRLEIAGIEVMEARIGYLAYAPEIANSMLRRQQATAIVAARYKIVEGAVGMVEQALEQLSTKDIIELDEEKKASMVSNLMVVLCGDRDATPIINTGSLYS